MAIIGVLVIVFFLLRMFCFYMNATINIDFVIVNVIITIVSSDTSGKQ